MNKRLLLNTVFISLASCSLFCNVSAEAAHDSVVGQSEKQETVATNDGSVEVNSKGKAVADEVKKADAKDAKKEEGSQLLETLKDVRTVLIGTNHINWQAFINDVSRAAASVRGKDRDLKAEEAFLKAICKGKLTESLFVNEGRNIGIQDDPMIKDQIKMMTDQIIARAYMQKVVFSRVTEDMCKAEYEEYKKDFPKEGIQILSIAVKDEGIAKEVIQKLKSGEKFADLAKKYSLAPSKNKGGEEETVAISDLPDNMRILATLKENDYIKEPVKGPMGYHILGVGKRVHMQAQEYDKVRREIEAKVLRSEMDKLLKTLVAKNKVITTTNSGKSVDIVKLILDEDNTVGKEPTTSENSVVTEKARESESDVNVDNKDDASSGQSTAESVQNDKSEDVTKDTKSDGLLGKVKGWFK